MTWYGQYRNQALITAHGLVEHFQCKRCSSRIITGLYVYTLPAKISKERLVDVKIRYIRLPLDSEVKLKFAPLSMADRVREAKRPFCERCQRPRRVCLCAVLPAVPIETKTSFIVMQTPAENKAKVNTAGLVTLCLRNSETISTRKESEASIPSNALLLFPTEGSTPLDQIQDQYNTVVLLDATWESARRVFSRSALLQSLRTASIPPESFGPPIFRARKAPTHIIEGARSTAEAVAAALVILEGNDARDAITALKRAVHEASEMQLRFIREKGPNAGRHRINRAGYEPNMYLQDSALSRGTEILCEEDPDCAKPV